MDLKTHTLASALVLKIAPRVRSVSRLAAELRHVERAAEGAIKPAEPRSGRGREAGPNDRPIRTYTRARPPGAKGPKGWSPGERRALDAAGVREFAEAVHVPPPRRGPEPRVAQV